MTLEIIMQVAGPVLAALGVYVGIRVDLAVSKERATHAMHEAARAHRRIDNLNSQHHRGNA